MSHDDERRQGHRGAIELRVEYQRLNTFFYDYTRNISHGGTFIRTRRPLEVGTHFRFKLFVPTLEAPLVLTGEVRWIHPEGDAGAPGMGIRFIFADDAERAAVDQTVEKLMVASLGRLITSRLREIP
jgi:type IV pilus assembly protein PilZ